MTSILTVSAPDLFTLRVTMDAVVDPATCSVPGNWAVSPSALAYAVLPTVATVQAGNLIVDLHVEPSMSPGEDYDVSAIGALDSTLLAIGGTVTAAAPLSDPSVSLEWDHGALRSVVRAMAEECQNYAGRPTTISTRDLQDRDVVLYGESFLGWPPDGGAFWIAGQRHTYTNVDPSFRALLGLYPDASVDSDGITIPSGSEVVCDVAASLPD